MEKKSKYEYNSQYAKRYLEKLDDIKIRVPAGERQEWKDAAARKGKSLNQFVIDAVHAEIDDTMERDGEE